MRRLLIAVVAATVAMGAAVSGCGPAAPPPSPTAVPAAPTKAPEPTKAAAAAPAAPTKAAAAAPAAPTAAPAKKVDYPIKGKTITIIVGYTAGGATDLTARLLASGMEKELGTTIQVVNKPGAGSQLAHTELVQSSPDGYTLATTTLPAIVGTYADPERKSIYTRKNFQTVGSVYDLPLAISVKASSPWRTIKDLVDEAKANPGKLKAGTTGVGSVNQLVQLQLMKLASVEFSLVHFDGGAPEATALLGGHIDLASNGLSEVAGHFKSGELRVLGLTGDAESEFLPGVKTLASQGYNVSLLSVAGLTLPAGTPKEIVDILDAALRKAIATDEVKTKFRELFFSLKHRGPAEFGAYWDQTDKDVIPLLELAKQATK